MNKRSQRPMSSSPGSGGGYRESMNTANDSAHPQATGHDNYVSSGNNGNGTGRQMQQQSDGADGTSKDQQQMQGDSTDKKSLGGGTEDAGDKSQVTT